MERREGANSDAALPSPLRSPSSGHTLRKALHPDRREAPRRGARRTDRDREGKEPRPAEERAMRGLCSRDQAVGRSFLSFPNIRTGSGARTPALSGTRGHRRVPRSHGADLHAAAGRLFARTVRRERHGGSGKRGLSSLAPSPQMRERGDGAVRIPLSVLIDGCVERRVRPVAATEIEESGPLHATQ